MVGENSGGKKSAKTIHTKKNIIVFDVNSSLLVKPSITRSKTSKNHADKIFELSTRIFVRTLPSRDVLVSTSVFIFFLFFDCSTFRRFRSVQRFVFPRAQITNITFIYYHYRYHVILLCTRLGEWFFRSSVPLRWKWGTLYAPLPPPP